MGGGVIEDLSRWLGTAAEARDFAGASGEIVDARREQPAATMFARGMVCWYSGGCRDAGQQGCLARRPGVATAGVR